MLHIMFMFYFLHFILSLSQVIANTKQNKGRKQVLVKHIPKEKKKKHPVIMKKYTYEKNVHRKMAGKIVTFCCKKKQYKNRKKTLLRYSKAVEINDYVQR